MKIRLIEPKAKTNNVYDHSKLPRLGLPQIGALLGKDRHDVQLYVESLAPVDWDDLLVADLIGFSTTTGTTPPAYDMADRLRAAGKTVVFGGAHVTFLPDEALDHADYVVRGEGHQTMLELVKALETGGDLSGIAGLSWHDGDQHCHNEARPNCDNATFGRLPVPDLSLIVGHENMITHPVMTQWGCPFDCNFCSVIKMFGRRVRSRPVEDVLDELEAVPAGRDVFFYDDNLVVDKRRTKALLSGMIERDINLTWQAQMRAEAIYADKKAGLWDTELLELMRDSHCDWVYIGFESVNPDALEEYNKHQTVDQIAESIRAFHQYGIRVHGMFVLGCDADTPQTIKATVDFAIEHQIDTVQFLSITPLPGTDFYYEMHQQERIISYDWSLYDGHHVLIQPAQMSAYELQMAAMNAMLRFYAPRRAWKMLLNNIGRELPFLWRLFWKERQIRLALPKITLMPFDHKMPVKVLETLQRALDKADWKRLRGVFIVPVFRRYAYYHVRAGMRQSQQYIAWLRGLLKRRSPETGGV